MSLFLLSGVGITVLFFFSLSEGSSQEKHCVGSTSQGSGVATALAVEVGSGTGAGFMAGVEEQPTQANSAMITNLMSS